MDNIDDFTILTFEDLRIICKKYYPISPPKDLLYTFMNGGVVNYLIDNFNVNFLTGFYKRVSNGINEINKINNDLEDKTKENENKINENNFRRNEDEINNLSNKYIYYEDILTKLNNYKILFKNN